MTTAVNVTECLFRYLVNRNLLYILRNMVNNTLRHARYSEDHKRS